MKEKILIIGGGLVGPLLSIYLKMKGFEVIIYEKNPESLISDLNIKRSSYNLTLTSRGLQALDHIGIGDTVRSNTRPLNGRIWHKKDQTIAYELYGIDNEKLYSIRRETLHHLLIDLVTNKFNIPILYDEKCIHIDYDKPEAYFQNQRTGKKSSVSPYLIFAADGAYSNVRYQLIKEKQFCYSQKYMQYGFIELSIPIISKIRWMKDNSFLHVWPRNTHLMIGFPNIDDTFTFTLFMPLYGKESFYDIKNENDFYEFFIKHYSDFLLDNDPELIKNFFSTSMSNLVSIQCEPWVHKNKLVLIGDAAHTIVPFYGQGINIGFEDCFILARLIDLYPGDWTTILSKYQSIRKPFSDLIAQLAEEHFYNLANYTNIQESSDIYRKISFTNLQYNEILQTLNN